MTYKIWIDENGVMKYKDHWPQVADYAKHEDYIIAVGVARSEAVEFEDQKCISQIALNYSDTPFLPKYSFFYIEIDGRIEIQERILPDFMATPECYTREVAVIIPEPKPEVAEESEDGIWNDVGEIMGLDTYVTKSQVDKLNSEFKITRR